MRNVHEPRSMCIVRHHEKRVVCVDRIGLRFIPKSEIQGQLRSRLPIVLNKKSEIQFTVLPEGRELRSQRNPLECIREARAKIRKACEAPRSSIAEWIKHVRLHPHD